MKLFAKLTMCFVVGSICGMKPPAARGEPAPTRYRGLPAELTINQLSERMVQVVLAPLDEATGAARPEPASSVVVEQRPQLMLRRRTLEGAEEVTLGKLTIEIEPHPLAISIRRPDGDIVQTLSFEEEGDTMSFRAAAPLLGMGEGAQQLDRFVGTMTTAPRSTTSGGNLLGRGSSGMTTSGD